MAEEATRASSRVWPSGLALATSLGADRAGGAGPILHQQGRRRIRQVPLDMTSQQPRGDIRGATGREGHDQRDRRGRIGGGVQGMRRHRPGQHGQAAIKARRGRRRMEVLLPIPSHRGASSGRFCGGAQVRTRSGPGPKSRVAGMAICRKVAAPASHDSGFAMTSANGQPVGDLRRPSAAFPREPPGALPRGQDLEPRQWPGCSALPFLPRPWQRRPPWPPPPPSPRPARRS